MWMTVPNAISASGPNGLRQYAIKGCGWAMNAVKPWMVIVLSVVLTFVTLAIMLATIGASTPDPLLLALCTAPCLATLGWGIAGAPLFDRLKAQLMMMPGFMFGIGLMLSVSDRYPPLWPFAVGAAATFSFLVLGCIVSWTAIQRAEPSGDGAFPPGPKERMIPAAMVFVAAGILFFQPLVLLVNGQAEARPPLVLQGTVARLYQTHGKGAAPYVVFSGPAATVNGTGTTGEFKVGWDAYRTYRLGGKQCVNLHTGLVHIRWWVIDDCGRAAQLRSIMQAWQTGNRAQTIAKLEGLAKRDPQSFNAINPAWLGMIRGSLDRGGEDELSQRVLALLASPTYQSADLAQSSDGYRYDYALKQIEAGDRAGAAATFARIDTPVLLMRATLDSRMRSLVPAHFSARAAVEREIADLRMLIQAHPDELGPKLRLAGAYLNLDDGQAMLAVLAPAKPGKENSGDDIERHDRQQWWWLMAQAYMVLGRYHDAVATSRNSMAPGEVNAAETAQLLNIAAIQLRFGRADEALATLTGLNRRPGRWNPMYESGLRELRGCASELTGRHDRVQTDLAYLLDNDANLRGGMVGALSCMHKDEEAAGILIRDIANPHKSASARLALSLFSARPATTPVDPYYLGYQRMLRRPDVQSALARAGGVGKFDIPPL